MEVGFWFMLDKEGLMGFFLGLEIWVIIGANMVAQYLGRTESRQFMRVESQNIGLTRSRIFGRVESP